MPADTGNENKNKSGVQKYGQKMRDRGSISSDTRSSALPPQDPKKQTQIRSAGERTVTLRQKTGSSKSNTKLAKERKKSRKDKRYSRFSTHGKAGIIAFFVILFVLLTVFAACLSYTYLVDRTENPIYADEIELDEATRVKFKIEKGASTNEIVEKLEEMDLIENSFIFKILSKFNGYDSMYKSGVHYLSKGLTYDEIMTLLSDEPLVVTVTFPEGFTTLQIAERLDANGVCSKDDFLRALNSTDVSSYSFLPKERGGRDYLLDGYLFPDTYEFEIDSSPETVIYKLLNRFNDIFKIEYYSRAERLGLTVDQIVTIASFVEKEARVASEREIIAGVYYNRLNSEDLKLMQCDATVLYSLRRRGIIEQSLTAEVLKIDDPYNTYVYEGLTPGPICSPSEASITAVITMDSHEYYYYVLKNDRSGTHIFSKTLEEHKAAIESQKTDD